MIFPRVLPVSAILLSLRKVSYEKPASPALIPLPVCHGRLHPACIHSYPFYPTNPGTNSDDHNRRKQSSGHVDHSSYSETNGACHDCTTHSHSIYGYSN